jgi:hypothetical protein
MLSLNLSRGAYSTRAAASSRRKDVDSILWFKQRFELIRQVGVVAPVNEQVDVAVRPSSGVDQLRPQIGRAFEDHPE